MTWKEINRFLLFVEKEEETKSRGLSDYSFPPSWGISTEEIDKALIVSISRMELLYEEFSYHSNTDITSQIEILLNWLLEQGIVILEPSQVREYLIRHFELIRILRSACKLTLDRLGMTSQLALEVYRDREIDDSYLTLNIRQHCYTQDILKQIEDVRAEYEVDLADSSGWFLVTTDFQPPL